MVGAAGWVQIRGSGHGLDADPYGERISAGDHEGRPYGLDAVSWALFPRR